MEDPDRRRVPQIQNGNSQTLEPHFGRVDRSETLQMAESRELVVSWPGTLAAAVITPPSGKPVIVVSMYAQWVKTHAKASKGFEFSDSSAHHVVSDLSTFIAKRDGHRVIAAGDLNILRGAGENGNKWWEARYKTVFDRMETLGLPCVGPECPNGRQAEPRPRELPRGSKNVPTFHPARKKPETATRQLDYVFASTELAPSLKVKALNEPGEWGQATIAGSRSNSHKELDSVGMCDVGGDCADPEHTGGRSR